MRKLKYNILFLFILILCGLNCKEVYTPPAIQNNPHLLVVDGIVITGNDSTIITLSRTRSIMDSAPALKEADAQVAVVGVSGVEYPLLYQGNGRYVTAQLPLDNTQKYQLKIITKDGNEFRSDLNSIHTSPPIDSLYWDQDSSGVNIYLNTEDPTNNTRYYRWEYVETWQYYSAFDSQLEYVDANNIIFRGLPNQVYRCYHTVPSSTIDVATTTQLSSDIVNKYKITGIAAGSEKLSAVYSILVKQYAIESDGFDFWKNLKKNTEQLGTLFDLQPFTELGNIHCLSHPEVKCVGYINFTTLQEKRIFIDKYQIYFWNYQPYYNTDEPCMVDTATPQNLSAFFLPPGGPYGNSLIGSGLDPKYHTSIYLFSTNLCVDCTDHGGSSVKPDYWP
jgi:hypothetical protein